MDAGTWEVPPKKWPEYFREVDSLSRGQSVEVEVMGTAIGDQALTRKTELKSIGLDTKASEGPVIELDLGEQEKELDHRIIRPVRVFATHTDAGSMEWLDIEDSDRIKTLIHFDKPVPMGAGPESSSFSGTTVSQYMTRRPVVLSSGSSLDEAQKLLDEKGIRHIPIVDAAGKLIGILSDRNMHLLKSQRGILPSDVTVDEVMTKNPYFVSPSTRLEEAAAAMGEHKFGSSVVVEKDQVVGILTTTDALRALVDLH